MVIVANKHRYKSSKPPLCLRHRAILLKPPKQQKPTRSLATQELTAMPYACFHLD